MTTFFRLTSCAALALPALMFSAPARGQTVTASALFQEAKTLMTAGAYDQACPKLQEAQRLYPTAGTVLTLGDCLEHAGKLASSWGAFKEAELIARNTKDLDREREAQRRSGLLSPKLARLAIVVPPAARMPGFELRRDGVLVGEAQWGSSLPIDVGPHTIETSAPGRKPWATVLRIETNGSTASFEVPSMPLQDTSDTAAAPFWSGRRIAGVVVGSVGAGSVIAGAIAGSVAASKASAAKPHCRSLGEATACDATGLSLRSDVRSFGNVANVTLVVGGSALVAGIVLLVTAPGETASKPAALRIDPVLGPDMAGLFLGGTW